MILLEPARRCRSPGGETMILEYSFGQVSGFTIDDFCAVAGRWVRDEKFDATSGESHLYEVQGERAFTEIPTQGVFISTYRTRAGGLHVAHRQGALFSRTPAGDYRRVLVRASLLGVWGLDDEHVFAWGLRGSEPVMIRRRADGEWEQMPSPGEIVFAMSGDAPDRLVAVGKGGTISLFDGSRWDAMLSPASGALGSVQWVSEDEIYACGTGERFILAGSVRGWKRRGPFELPLHCVAKHRDTLWVGCGRAGLHRLTPGEDSLELVKPNVEARHFDAREHLLISTPNVIASTEDGEYFPAQFIEGYKRLAERLPPSFPATP